MYHVRRLKLGRNEQIDALAQIAGALYSHTVVSFWRTVRKGVWLRPSSLMRWHTDPRLHAHTADAVVQQFFGALNSWRKRRKEDPNAHPPRRRPRFGRLQWKNSAIRVRDGNLALSNGRQTAPLVLPWVFEQPAIVEIGWDGIQYELRAVYAVDATATPLGTGVAGIDLGEVHVAAACDGTNTTIVSGRYLRSKRRYQNKLKAQLSSQLDRKKRGSRRRERLARSKARQLRKLQHQVNDVLHKQTSHLVSTLHASGVQTVAIGDVRSIRQRTNLGKNANQKLHQWLAGATRWMLTYKSERLGMNVELVDERYTSQECPACRYRTKPTGRRYRCRSCRATFHRDQVGALNIRAKYLGAIPVVGVMAPPTGVRFHPHLRRSSRVPAVSAA
ncbi:MAG: RNA-guided endonuclease InsQ/TnpB family protein [Vulcanimicrobiaceae bacterium]